MFGYKQLQNQQNRFGLSIKSPCNASIKSMQIVCDDRRSTQKKRNAEGKPIPPFFFNSLMIESVSTQKWTFTILLHMLDVSNSQFSETGFTFRTSYNKNPMLFLVFCADSRTLGRSGISLELSARTTNDASSCRFNKFAHIT